MKISIIFTGLERTIDKTYKNIRENLIDDINDFNIHFVTWENESVEKFKIYFPEAKIYYIKPIDIENIQFHQWKTDFNIHSSWLEKYKTNEFALFNYFRQIYLWKEASKIIDSIESDIYIRCRTDIIIKDDNIKDYYSLINLNKSDTLFFPNEPRHGAFGDYEKGCPDYIMIGNKEILKKALCIVDYLYKYKYTNNVIQPESSMYLFLKGENININYMGFHIEIVR